MTVNNLSIIFLVIICILFLYGGWLVFLSSKKNQGKWGININSPKEWLKSGISKNITCPICGKTIKGIRRPKGLYEILWGGYTCSGCGAKLDKWGDLRGKKKDS